MITTNIESFIIRLMVAQVALWLVPCGVVSYVILKMGGRTNKSQQWKVLSLFLVIATVGFLLITTSYNGLLRNLFANKKMQGTVNPHV